ncbi:uncharacterized protein LOC143246494 isoform X3 [Tachypleus tridentatus]
MLNEIDEPKVSIVDIEDEDRVKGDILYSVDEVPRWYLCILLGIQVFLTIVIAWVFCFTLTAAGALGPTNLTRTDIREEKKYSCPSLGFLIQESRYKIVIKI